MPGSFLPTEVPKSKNFSYLVKENGNIHTKLGSRNKQGAQTRIGLSDFKEFLGVFGNGYTS